MRLPLAALLLLAACSSDAASRRAELVVRDSAGIAIRELTSAVLDDAPVLALDTVPITEVRGSADDIAADISTLSLSTFTERGHLVASDYQAGQVVIIPMDGTAPLRIGQRGAGPGEFRFVGDARWLLGDSLAIPDFGNARVTIIDPAGTIVRTVATGPLSARGTSAIAGRVGGRWIGFGSIGSSMDEASEEMHLKASAMVEDGEPAVPLFRTRADSSDVERKLASGSREPIAVNAGIFTAFPELRVAGDAMVHLDAGRGQVVERDAEGTVRVIHRIGWPKVFVSRAIWEAYIDDQLARMRNSSDPADAPPPEVRQQMLGLAHPDTLPVASRMEVTPRGTLWVERFRTPGDSAWEAVAIARDGTLLGRLLGAGTPPSVYGDDRVALRVEDEDGIATIRILRLRTP